MRSARRASAWPSSGGRPSARGAADWGGGSAGVVRPVAVKEVHHRAGEHVIAITRDHVRGIGYVNVLRLRGYRPESRDILLAHDLADPAADKHDGHLNPGQCLLEPLRRGLPGTAGFGEHPRIPVPVIAAVVTPPEVLAQPADV